MLVYKVRCVSFGYRLPQISGSQRGTCTSLVGRGGWRHYETVLVGHKM